MLGRNIGLAKELCVHTGTQRTRTKPSSSILALAMPAMKKIPT
jgi:hypothetical protein